MLSKWSYYAESVARLLTGFRAPHTIIRLFTRGVVGTTEIQLRSGERFEVRTALDAWTVKETFLDRFYDRYGGVVQPGWTVIDIGGGFGDFVVHAAKLGGTVHGYEPHPESRALLERNVVANAVAEQVTVHTEAVSDRVGTLRLVADGSEPLDSEFREHGAGIEVRSIPLTEALDRTESGRCDLLKMDCEGAEYPILMSADTDTLARVDRIVMEWHDDGQAPEHEDLARFLADNGFAVRSWKNRVHGHIGYLAATRTGA